MLNQTELSVIALSCARHQKLLFTALSFELQKGELLLVEGENGSGKSSLLSVLAGLATPLAGEIFWRGKATHQLADEYKHDLHYVNHTNGIKLGLTVLENLQLMQYFAGNPVQCKLQEVLVLLQLEKQQQTLAKYLSAGQKRRLALARLFMFPSPLWILDEPCTALDQNTQTLFLSLLEKHLQSGGTAIMSTHQGFDIKTIAIKRLRLESC